MNDDLHSCSRRFGVFIPMRNEELNIVPCVESVLRALDHGPSTGSVVIIDDGSTDGSVSAVRSIGDPRVRLVVRDDLPRASRGKSDALALGYASASAVTQSVDFLLFLDADVRLGSATFAAIEVWMEDLDAFSMSPGQRTHGFMSASLQPLVFDLLDDLFPFQEVNDSQSPCAAANGQFFCFRKDFYDLIGTHAAVADEVVEDVALASRTKAAGGRLRFESGVPFGVSCLMYRSFRDLVDGWSKNAYPLARSAWCITISFLVRLAATVVLVGILLAIALVSWGWLGFLGAFVAYTAVLAPRTRSFYSPAHLAMGTVLLVYVLVRSSYWYRIRKEVLWKGRRIEVSGA